MRLRRRYLVLAFASLAALTVGGVASADHGPGPPDCGPVFPSGCKNNTSSIPTWNVTPSALPGSGGGGNGGSGAVAPVTLDIGVHNNYAHPNNAAEGGKVANDQLTFDNDIVINLAGVPSCTAAGPGGLPDWQSDTTIKTAWEQCGPGADVPASDPKVNAYLSPFTAVSGTISTAPTANFAGCNLIFKKDATHVILFARVFFAQTADCGDKFTTGTNPANNDLGNLSTVLTGTLSNVTTADRKPKLTVPLPASIPIALDDFKAKLKRASVFSARCKDTNKLLHLTVRFQYTDSQVEQPPDTVTKTKACT